MNKTITMYELMGLVKDGKAPKKIKYDNYIFEYDGIYYMTKNNTYLDEYCDLSRVLNDEVEILEEEKKTIDCLNLSLEEIEAFQEARQIFLKLNNEEDKQTFIKLLIGEGTYQRWLDYLKSKGDE